VSTTRLVCGTEIKIDFILYPIFTFGLPLEPSTTHLTPLCCQFYLPARPFPSRKYVPIDISKVESQLIPCHKAFVDVFSSSLEDPGAMVCCRDHVEINDDAMSPNPMICVPPVRPTWIEFGFHSFLEVSMFMCFVEGRLTLLLFSFL